MKGENMETIRYKDGMPAVSQKEFCEHIEDDDFLEKYGNPVRVICEDGNDVVCMSIGLYERMQEALHDSDIRYWMYEFRGDADDIAELQKIAEENRMTMDEFFEACVRNMLAQAEKDPEGMKKLVEEASAEKSRFDFVRCYPVHYGETEAEASERNKA